MRFWLLILALACQAATVKTIPGDYAATQAGLQTAINAAAGNGWIIEIQSGTSINVTASPGLTLPANATPIEIRTQGCYYGNRMVTQADASSMATIVLDYNSTSANTILAATTTTGTPVGYYTFRCLQFTGNWGTAIQTGTFLSLGPAQSAVTPGQETTNISVIQCILQGNPTGFGPANGIVLQGRNFILWQNYITDVGNNTSGDEAHAIAYSSGLNNGDFRYNVAQGTMGFIGGGGGGFPAFPTNPVMIPSGLFFAGNTFRNQARYRYSVYAADPHGTSLPGSCVAGQSFYNTSTMLYSLCATNVSWYPAQAGIANNAECYVGEFWRNSSSGALWLCTGTGTFGTFTTTLTDPSDPNPYMKNAFEIKKCAGCLLYGNTIGPTFEPQFSGQVGTGTFINAVGCAEDGRWAVIRDIRFESNRYINTETMSLAANPGPNQQCTDRALTLSGVSGTFHVGNSVSDGTGGTGTVNSVQSSTQLVVLVNGVTSGSYFAPGDTITDSTSGATGLIVTATNNGPTFNQPTGYVSWKNNLTSGLADARSLAGFGLYANTAVNADSLGLYTAGATGTGMGSNYGPFIAAHNTIIASAVQISGSGTTNPRLNHDAALFGPSSGGSAFTGVSMEDNILPYGLDGLLADIASNSPGCNASQADGVVAPNWQNNSMVNTAQFVNGTITGWYSQCPNWQWPLLYDGSGLGFVTTPSSLVSAAGTTTLTCASSCGIQNGVNLRVTTSAPSVTDAVYLVTSTSVNSSTVTLAPSLPTGTYTFVVYNDVGFTNFSGGNYALASTSQLKGTAHDGTDPGADTAIVGCATATNGTGAYNPYHDFTVTSEVPGSSSATVGYTGYSPGAAAFVISLHPTLSSPLSPTINDTGTGRARSAAITGLGSKTAYYFRLTDSGSGCYINGQFTTN